MSCPRFGTSKCRCLAAYTLKPNVDGHMALRKVYSDYAYYLNNTVDASYFNTASYSVTLVRLSESISDVGIEMSRLHRAKNTTQHMVNYTQALISCKDVKHQGDLLAALLSSFNPEATSLEFMRAEIAKLSDLFVNIISLLREGRFSEKITAFDVYYNQLMYLVDLFFVSYGR